MILSSFFKTFNILNHLLCGSTIIFILFLRRIFGCLLDAFKPVLDFKPSIPFAPYCFANLMTVFTCLVPLDFIVINSKSSISLPNNVGDSPFISHDIIIFFNLNVFPYIFLINNKRQHLTAVHFFYNRLFVVFVFIFDLHQHIYCQEIYHFEYSSCEVCFFCLQSVVF